MSQDEAVSSVLAFYSSELTSHGALLVGFLVSLFTLVQAPVREALGGWVFSVFAEIVLWGSVFSALRIVYYGKLSSAVMYSNRLQLQTWMNQHDWLIRHGQINGFAVDYVGRSRYGRILRPRGSFPAPVGLVISFGIALVLVISMNGWWGLVVQDAIHLME